MNEIVGGDAWSLCTGKVLQQLDFDNPISPNDVVRFINKDSFCVISFYFFIFFLWYVSLYVIMTMSSSSFLWVFYFFLLFIITEVVSLPSKLVIYPSDLSLDGVLVLLELLLCVVSCC